MISREDAKEIATFDTLFHKLGFAVSAVRSVDEICYATPVLYNVNLNNAWIAYIEPVGQHAIQASVIVVVDRDTGLVLYRGSANDEG
jgi:hypothetical protein